MTRGEGRAEDDLIEASLLITLCLLVLALSAWNIMVHHWLSQGRTQEAAHRAQMEARMQGLARRLSDAEELLGAVSDPKPHIGPDRETEPSTVPTEAEAGSETRAGKGLRPAEAELLAKLSRYREQSPSQRAHEDGITGAVWPPDPSKRRRLLAATGGGLQHG